ncbi:efflux transporter outer membrane subunit [Dokdonella sp.]|uniref:efflux transporter outer membrane subunit n=1 Tax=Dokdonella sp. TaxID=2291710 RepID=UPI003C4EDE98
MASLHAYSPTPKQKLCGIGLLSALIVVALGGCALQPAPTHSKIVADALPTDTSIPSEWKIKGASGPVDDDWLRSFGDAGLESVVTEALANSPDLRRVAAMVTAAQQSVIVVGAQMKPLVGINLGARSTRDRDWDSTFQSSKGLLGVAWEADVWGRIRSQQAAAEAGYASARLDYEFARMSLAATVAKSWYQTTESMQLQALASRSVDIHAKLFELVRIRREAGKVGDLDVAESNASLNAAKADLAEAEALTSQSRRVLETLVGRYPAAELHAAREFVPVPAPSQASLPSALLERRPDLLAAEQLVIASFRESEAARLALLPGLSLNLGAGKINDGVLSVLRLNPWLLDAGIGISIPLYVGGALKAEVEIANAEQEQAVAEYAGSMLRAFREVENNLENEDSLARQLKFDELAMDDHANAVRIANIQFKAGRIDLLSLLQLQESLIASEAQVIKLKNAQLANRIDLNLSLGGSIVGSQVSQVPAPIDTIQQ